MRNKIYSPLKISLLLTAAIPATSVLAQFVGQFNPNPTPPTPAPPHVRIFTPPEGAVFLLGANIQICADADFFTNPIANVEFFAGTNVLGVVSNSLAPWARDHDVFCLTVSNLAVGDYSLTATATDTGGNSATSPGVDIEVVTNIPPKVRIVQPPDGACIPGPTNIQICAAAYDQGGTVVSVEFFEGTNSLGAVPAPSPVFVTNHMGVFPIILPFCITWSNAPLGTCVLTAVATDNGGASSTSAPVNINVVSNLPPIVHMVSPFEGMTFFAPARIELSAAAGDRGGKIASVQFFNDGTNSLGVVTNPVPIIPPPVGPGPIVPLASAVGLYSLTWSNVAAGGYSLTAVATDNGGLSTTSAPPVTITVLAPPPPKVSIFYPHNGQKYYDAPVNVEICALERNFTNPVANVQFFAGTNGIGATTESPFSCIIWSNAPAGAYSLTAVATDTSGITATSGPVSITVTTNPPPRRAWGH